MLSLSLLVVIPCILFIIRDHGFSNAYIGWKSSIEGHGLQRATPVQRALSAKGVSASVVSRVQGQLDKLAQLFRQVGQSD